MGSRSNRICALGIWISSMTSFLISGGTGSWGRAFTQYLLCKDHVKRIVIYSRDEQKQNDMEREIEDPNKRVRFMLGDVRDYARLQSAMRGIDIVINAAALKIVPSCEYSPIEAVHTNITGAENIIQASIASGVSKAITLSTDKAVSP